MSALKFVSHLLVAWVMSVWLYLKGRGVKENSRTWSSPFARAARLRTCQLYSFLLRYLTLNATNIPRAKLAKPHPHYG